MKRILLSARNLQIGGIEKALITLIDYLLEKNYNITLVLEEKKGDLLKDVEDKVKIIEYTPSKNKIKLIRKIINLLKRIIFIIRYYHKFDCSISFATYLKSGSFVARVASKNSILWCHADYLSLYNGNKESVEEFFDELYYEYFSKIVFVSKKARETFLEVFPKQLNTYYCNNLIDYRRIYEQSQENINYKYNDNVITFLNVGRHDEKQKKLTRILAASAKLKSENYKFRVIFVGDGRDTKKYKEIVKKYELEKNVIFVGAKTNPYPYFKFANCIILSSDYEGYPVVFLESFILNKPIITTNVSDCKEVQKGKGIVVQKNVIDIYKAMKDFIENGYFIKDRFDIRKHNEEMKIILEEILE